MIMNAVIVDDEYLALKIIEQYADELPTLSISKSFINPQEALAHLLDCSCDLLFLDIQMPDLNGFDLLNKITHPPLIIFTTARHDFAVKAFELDVVDYLVKPFSFERFEKAVRRAQEYLAYKKSKNLVSHEYLMIRANHRVHKIMLEEIEYLEGLGEYVKLFANGKMYITYGALKDFILQLPATKFFRIHKSYIVSKKIIRSYSSQSVKLQNEKEIPVGRSFKDTFAKWMT
jgi:two-component system, LytTR family, response regulator LytT